MSQDPTGTDGYCRNCGDVISLPSFAMCPDCHAPFCSWEHRTEHLELGVCPDRKDQDRTETRVVLVKPGDLLLIGNTGEFTAELDDAQLVVSEVLGELGVRVVLFPGDIDIAALAEGEIPAEATP